MSINTCFLAIKTREFLRKIEIKDCLLIKHLFVFEGNGRVEATPGITSVNLVCEDPVLSEEFLWKIQKVIRIIDKQ